jgi:hypothetical protein
MENIEDPLCIGRSGLQGSKAVFFDSKLLLAGDALNLYRPHCGRSTSQAAFHVQQLVKCLEGEMSLKMGEDDPGIH